jgi:hypothetical protein
VRQGLFDLKKRKPAATWALPTVNRGPGAGVLAPVGRRVAGLGPAHVLEERILLVQAARGHRQPICTMSRHSPWPFSILASSKACKQQAFSRAVHVAMAEAPPLGSTKV